MDNFVISTRTKKKLEERTIHFLKVTEKYNLCFKQSKYDFDAEEIPNLRDSSWKRRSSNREQQDQDDQEMENPYKNKRSRELLRVCKLLPMFY